MLDKTADYKGEIPVVRREPILAHKGKVCAGAKLLAAANASDRDIAPLVGCSLEIIQCLEFGRRNIEYSSEYRLAGFGLVDDRGLPDPSMLRFENSSRYLSAFATVTNAELRQRPDKREVSILEP